MDTRTDPTQAPGDLVLRPAVASSLGTLILNDHVLKGRWPGWFTGKASDLVGLYAFPLVVVAGTEVTLWVGRRRTSHAGWAVPAVWAGAVIATVAAGFVAIKLAQPAGGLYQAGLGTLRWLPGAGLRAVTGGEPGAPGRAALVRDPTDLVALVALWPAWRTARRRTRPPDAAPEASPELGSHAVARTIVTDSPGGLHQGSPPSNMSATRRTRHSPDPGMTPSDRRGRGQPGAGTERSPVSPGR